jgi:DNA-binding response OmpR family regulator
VVEDEKQVASFIKKGLQEEAHAVDVATNGPDGEFLAQTSSYDLIVLDLMLPGKDGVEVCKTLRARKVRTPILMLTARDSLEAKVEGLDSGADDYLTKPFAFEEFLARVRALLRRDSTGDSASLRVGELALDRNTRKAQRGTREIVLTSREYSLLEFFMRRSGKVLSRAVIAEHVWGLDFDPQSNVIDVTVSHLRIKVDRGASFAMIRTVRGAGYMLCEEDDK